MITMSVVLTYSRGGAIGLGAVLLLLLLMRHLRLRHLAVIGICVAIVFATVPSYKERLLSLGAVSALTAADGGDERADGAIRSRATENLAAFLIFTDHPVIGVGPGLYNTFYRAYADRVQDYSNQLDVRHKNRTRDAHNLYLGITAETGALGLACLLGLLFMTLRSLYRARQAALRAGVPRLANMADGFTAAIVSYMVTGVFLHLSFMRYFWLMMALAVSASVIAQRSIAFGRVASREPGKS
jgi:putative inorganic carbon (HCO3(-)) transporter